MSPWTYPGCASVLLDVRRDCPSALVSQILVPWFFFQVLGPRSMPFVVIWNMCLRNENFNNHDLAYEVSVHLDDVILAVLTLLDEDPVREDRTALRQMVCSLLPFLRDSQVNEGE
jgi:hypothetical protein